jgi:hypothetical protein
MTIAAPHPNGLTFDGSASDAAVIASSACAVSAPTACSFLNSLQPHTKYKDVAIKPQHNDFLSIFIPL